MGANYLFELISIVHSVPQFIGHNKIFLGSVRGLSNKSEKTILENVSYLKKLLRRNFSRAKSLVLKLFTTLKVLA